jgi:DNA-binding NarL/FixJ family response regulator
MRGFMLKETPLGELAAAVRQVAEGARYVDAALPLTVRTHVKNIMDKLEADRAPLRWPVRCVAR